MDIVTKLKYAAAVHPLDANQTLFKKAAALIEQQEARLTRLVRASNAMKQDIVKNLPVDDDGFQPYTGDKDVWCEFWAAIDAAQE